MIKLLYKALDLLGGMIADLFGGMLAATTVTIASCIVAIFTGLYPNVMVSSTKAADNLTVHNTASGHYAPKVMTVVVIVLLPAVLLYEAWTCYVSRRRVSRSEIIRHGAIRRQRCVHQ